MSVDLDASGYKWFQGLQKKHAADVRIDLVQACDIVHELIHRRTLREQYFLSDTLELIRELKSAVALGPSERSLGERATLTTETAQQYLDLLKEQDPRYSYEVSFGGDQGPTQQGAGRGEAAAVTDGRKTVRAFPRDLSTLRLDPPRGTLRVQGSGKIKLEEFIRTGKQQELVGDEVIEFKGSLPLLSDAGGKPGYIALRPSAPREKMPLRVTFGREPSAIVYDCVEFTNTRSGTEEIELVSASDLPFDLTLVVRFDGRVTFTVSDRTVGSDLHSASKFLRALRTLVESKCVEFFLLKQGISLTGSTDLEFGEPTWLASRERLVEALLKVSRLYGVHLLVPSALTPVDLKNLNMLLQLPDGCQLSAEDTMTLEVEHPGPMSGASDARHGDVKFEGTTDGHSLELLGRSIPTGPLELTFEGGTVENFGEYRAWTERAATGECLLVKVKLTNGGCLRKIRRPTVR